jgi:hypothetical protein
MRKNQRHSEATKEKLRLAQLGRRHPHSQASREKMRLSHTGHVCSEATKEKLRQLHLGKKHSPHTEATKEKIRNSNLGQKRSEETIRRMILERTGKKHPRAPQSLAARQKMSETRIKLIKSGYRQDNVIKRYKSGKFYSDKNKQFLYYRSSYELVAFKMFEQMENIRCYEPEPFLIYYVGDDSKEHIYIPDILITYKDKTKEIIEVKPERRLKEASNILKFEAGKKYAIDHNMKYRVITEKTLNIAERTK